MDDEVVIYRFRRIEAHRVISPRHMWGTRESIAALEGFSLVPETARIVPRDRLEHGFVFDKTLVLAADD